MNAARMWNLLADLIHSYLTTGMVEQAFQVLAQALDSEPMWIPNALFDERIAGLRDHPEFARLTTLPPDDGPALFNAAMVALEYDRIQEAENFLRQAFQLALEDETLEYLLEAIQAESDSIPQLLQPPLADLVARYSAQVRPADS